MPGVFRANRRRPGERGLVTPNPILAFLEHQGFMMLDGGLATTLEAHGCDLDDPLWSARALLESPGIIKDVHRAFLDAGADCIATASYQATIEGFVARGCTLADARGLIQRSAVLALDARNEFWADAANRARRLRPLVAASVGPYGAFLADGSEYRGDYELDESALYDFHGERWQLLSETAVDLMACETIPSLPEVRALLRLVDETGRWAWLSVSCRDADHLSDGTDVREVAILCDAVPYVAAVGVNCVAPSMVTGLVRTVSRVTDKPVLAYPNSGEEYDAATKRWRGVAEPSRWPLAEWRTAGAKGIGGCCRVSPAAITRMRERLGAT